MIPRETECVICKGETLVGKVFIYIFIRWFFSSFYYFACPFELVRGLTLDLISSLGFLVVVVPAPHINNTHRNRNNYNNTENIGV